MKIMICISQLKKGGAERVVTNLANYFIKENEVTLVSLKAYNPEYELNDNIKVIKLDKETKQNKAIKILKRIFSLDKSIKKEKPDIILSFLPEPSFLVLLLKKIRKIKVIVSVRNDPKVEYKKKLYNLAMKILYPLADGFVFQTEEAKEFFSEDIQKKSTIILNSLNPDFIVEKPYIGQRNKEIVTVGRLFEQKNHAMLINAFEKIYTRYPDYKLTIYGEGPLRKQLEKQIKDLKLNNCVLLPGLEKDIKNKIYKSKIFVLSSIYEGLPNSLMEAMALGIPSISTDCPCGGPQALIDDGQNGFLVEVNNIDMLVQKIIELIENEELYNKISLKSNEIKEKINPEIINLQWNEYVNKIAKDERE